MSKLFDAFRRAEAGLSLISRRGRTHRSRKTQLLHRCLELKTARRLRRSLAAVITEVDADVMEDLMRILRKLSKGTGHDKSNDYDLRLKLALELTNMSFSKSKPPHPDTLMWTFTQFYNKIEPLFQQPPKS